MNKLYLLLIWTCMSCHSDTIENQNQLRSNSGKVSDFAFTREVIDSIRWNTTTDFYSQDYIAESLFFTAEFDYYACIVTKRSVHDIEVYYDRHCIYLISSRKVLQKAHSLEYADIDDYYASVEQPSFTLGRYKDYSILKIPLNSNLECISELSVILLYHNF